MTQTTGAAPVAEAPLGERIQQVLDDYRPTLYMDGGDVEVLEIDGKGIVHLKMMGACIDCPISLLTMKLGIQRLLKEHFPALAVNPVDVLGAGDASLSGLSVSICAGADLMEASAIAAGVASMAVNKVGNTPVTFSELREWLKKQEDTER